MVKKLVFVGVVIIGVGVGFFLSQPSRDVIVDAQPFSSEVQAYFDIQSALAHDNLEKTKQIAQIAGFHEVMHVATIQEARVAFEKFTQTIEALITSQGVPAGQHVYKYHCPMVDGNRGASWLQHSKGTKNPYFGSQMFSCGSQVKEL